ncbi:DMT family transporter [Alicyclobacillus tolerans]|uniref:DMT family transporter n=1 Tax=Alicyclobacillus tolerans TaxID=90970 RepID=UPI001F3C8BCC|nr:DMT family transporter [Alicyclobacillus tolerans]MCF8564648.1 DMT family transporter [Alicyclobacillus tolerans]
MEHIKKIRIDVSNVTRQGQSPLVSIGNKIWRSRWTADISLLLVALVWGTTYVASKDVVSSVPVMQFLFIRFLLTTVLMLPLTFNAIRKADRSTWLTGIVFGLFLFAIFTLETYGVANTSAANAGFLISLFAVMVPLIQSVVYRKRPKLTLLGAVILSVLGTALLTLHGYHINIGDYLVLGAAFCRAVQMTFTKKLTDGKAMNSGALTTIQLGVVAIGSGFVTIFQHPSYTHLTISFWLITGYLAVFATMFAFFIQLTMIRRTSPSRVAVLMSSEPIFAALASVLILGESLSVVAMIGGACIVAGMLWARKLT